MPVKAIVFDAYGTLYDVQSVGRALEAAFPSHSDYLSQVWRLKQLEYSWLRSMMGRYQDFRTVTRDALVYALGTLGLGADPALLDQIVAAYNTLTPYPEAAEALHRLRPHRRAILSNGTQAMLDALVSHSNLQRSLEAVISVDPKRAYKPDPRAYELVEERLGVPPPEILFVTSNGFDVAGAKAFGFRVARIERVTPQDLRQELRQDLSASPAIGPAALYRALRSQSEILGETPDITVNSLLELADAVQAGRIGD